MAFRTGDPMDKRRTYILEHRISEELKQESDRSWKEFIGELTLKVLDYRNYKKS